MLCLFSERSIDTIIDFNKTQQDKIQIAVDLNSQISDFSFTNVTGGVALNYKGNKIAEIKNVSTTNITVNDLEQIMPVDPNNGTNQGHSGNDTLYGDLKSNKADTLSGGEGNDTAYGGQENDLISGGNGNDSIEGEPGNDTLYGGDGSDKIEGDKYDTTTDVNNSSNVIHGGDGSDTIHGLEGNNYIEGGSGDDIIYSGYRGIPGKQNSPDDHKTQDTIKGGQGNDTIHGDSSGENNNYGGNDLLEGGDGDDVIYGYGGSDTIDGGKGSNLLYGDEGNDFLKVGSPDDLLKSLDGKSYGDNYMDGGKGNDSLTGNIGNDVLNGNGDADTLTGGAGADKFWLSIHDSKYDTITDFDKTKDKFEIQVDEKDTISEVFNKFSFVYDTTQGGVNITYNGPVYPNKQIALVKNITAAEINNPNYFKFVKADALGNTTIEGASTGDDLYGRTTSDLIQGNGGNDTIESFRSNDTLQGGEGDDWLNGGQDNDSLDGGNGEDNLIGENENDVLTGLAGDDILSGNSGADTLDGGDDNDRLFGGNDNDILNGGNHDDILFGGNGNDILTGGGEADRFELSVFTTGFDTIKDFTPGSDELRIHVKEISQAEFNKFTTTGVGSNLSLKYNGTDIAVFENLTAGQLNLNINMLDDSDPYGGGLCKKKPWLCGNPIS